MPNQHHGIRIAVWWPPGLLDAVRAEASLQGMTISAWLRAIAAREVGQEQD
jgi:hypothetical protein